MKVNIIGAGVSGLAAGCYLQMSGFESEIFESQAGAGGLCTSWKKGGYTFESGFQWLLGSGPANPFYQLWSELLDMENISFVTHESRMDIELNASIGPQGEKVFHLYTDIDRLGKYMTELSPPDKAVIDRLIKSMRKMQSFEIPPLIKKVPELLPPGEKISYIRYLPLLWFLNRTRKETNFSFARKLKSPFLKEAFELLFDGQDLPLMIITMPLANNDLKAAGYAIGGAGRFISKLRDRYLSLGGKIRYNSHVSTIMTNNHKACGLRLENGEELQADVVVSAADWKFTVFGALGGKYVNKTITRLGALKMLQVYYSIVIVSLGIKRRFENEPHFLRFQLDRDLVSPDNTKYSRAEAHIFNYDPSLAPEGSTVVSVSFYTRNAEFWINLRKTDRQVYNKLKMGFANEVIEVLEKKFGSVKDNIEEIDVATPATFERYTGNWKGSVQGWLPGSNIIARSPVKYKLPGLGNFYYSGHWSIPGGGLPVAIKSARDVVQFICRDTKHEFGCSLRD